MEVQRGRAIHGPGSLASSADCNTTWRDIEEQCLILDQSELWISDMSLSSSDHPGADNDVAYELSVQPGSLSKQPAEAANFVVVMGKRQEGGRSPLKSPVGPTRAHLTAPWDSSFLCDESEGPRCSLKGPGEGKDMTWGSGRHGQAQGLGHAGEFVYPSLTQGDGEQWLTLQPGYGRPRGARGLGVYKALPSAGLYQPWGGGAHSRGGRLSESELEASRRRATEQAQCLRRLSDSETGSGLGRRPQAQPPSATPSQQGDSALPSPASTVSSASSFHCRLVAHPHTRPAPPLSGVCSSCGESSDELEADGVCLECAKHDPDRLLVDIIGAEEGDSDQGQGSGEYAMCRVRGAGGQRWRGGLTVDVSLAAVEGELELWDADMGLRSPAPLSPALEPGALSPLPVAGGIQGLPFPASRAAPRRGEAESRRQLQQSEVRQGKGQGGVGKEMGEQRRKEHPAGTQQTAWGALLAPAPQQAQRQQQRDLQELKELRSQALSPEGALPSGRPPISEKGLSKKDNSSAPGKPRQGATGWGRDRGRAFRETWVRLEAAAAPVAEVQEASIEGEGSTNGLGRSSSVSGGQTGGAQGDANKMPEGVPRICTSASVDHRTPWSDRESESGAEEGHRASGRRMSRAATTLRGRIRGDDGAPLSELEEGALTSELLGLESPRSARHNRTLSTNPWHEGYTFISHAAQAVDRRAAVNPEEETVGEGEGALQAEGEKDGDSAELLRVLPQVQQSVLPRRHRRVNSFCDGVSVGHTSATQAEEGHGGKWVSLGVQKGTPTLGGRYPGAPYPGRSGAAGEVHSNSAHMGQGTRHFPTTAQALTLEASLLSSTSPASIASGRKDGGAPSCHWPLVQPLKNPALALHHPDGPERCHAVIPSASGRAKGCFPGQWSSTSEGSEIGLLSMNSSGESSPSTSSAQEEAGGRGGVARQEVPDSPAAPLPRRGASMPRTAVHENDGGICPALASRTLSVPRSPHSPAQQGQWPLTPRGTPGLHAPRGQRAKVQAPSPAHSLCSPSPEPQCSLTPSAMESAALELAGARDPKALLLQWNSLAKKQGPPSRHKPPSGAAALALWHQQ